MIKNNLKTLMYSILYLLIIFTFNLTAVGENDWKLIQDNNGVKVYKRTFIDSPVDEFRGVTIVNAKIEVIGEVLSNFSDHPKWMDRCKENKSVKIYEDGSRICHITIDVPWPFSARDIIAEQTLDVSLNKEKRTVIITIDLHSIDYPGMPPKEGSVRIKNFTSKYILEYIDRNNTKVTFQTKTDLGGNMPKEFANYGNRSVPYNTLFNLHKEVKKKKYESLAIDPSRMNKENLFITKIMLTTLIKRYIKDEEMIDNIVNDELIKQVLVSNDLTEKAVSRIILKAELQKQIKDKKVIDEIINNDDLLNNIIKGKVPTMLLPKH